jgi:TRAP-type mannitol/chloroaromatic compound transport system substrate-binding protein
VQGIRFRTPGLGGRVWERLGATVTNLAGGEIFQALQSGALDAAEFVGPYNDLALGFHQIAKNYYFPSFIEPGLATELVVDKAKYLALPEDLQAIVRDCCQAEYDQVASDFYANDPRGLAGARHRPRLLHRGHPALRLRHQLRLDAGSVCLAERRDVHGGVAGFA